MTKVVLAVRAAVTALAIVSIAACSVELPKPAKSIHYFERNRVQFQQLADEVTACRPVRPGIQPEQIVFVSATQDGLVCQDSAHSPALLQALMVRLRIESLSYGETDGVWQTHIPLAHGGLFSVGGTRSAYYAPAGAPRQVYGVVKSRTVFADPADRRWLILDETYRD